MDYFDLDNYSMNPCPFKVILSNDRHIQVYMGAAIAESIAHRIVKKNDQGSSAE
jgi:hypothetical protein